MHPIERLRNVARSPGADQRVLVHEAAEAIRSLGDDPGGLVVACRRIVERHPSGGPLWWLCASLLGAPDPFGAARALAREIESDPTPGRLAADLTGEATVCIVGWPDLIGDALDRRGDVRVLAVDLGGQAGSLVRRLQRSGIDAEVVEPAGSSSAVLAADVVLVEALACTPAEAIVPAGSRAVASVAACTGIPAWLVAGRGRRMPGELFSAMRRRQLDQLGRGRWDLETEAMPIALCSTIVGPERSDPVDAAGRALAPECACAPELLRASPM